MKKSDKYNASGYMDMTAYHALKNIERETAENEKSIHKRKLKKRRTSSK